MSESTVTPRVVYFNGQYWAVNTALIEDTKAMLTNYLSTDLAGSGTTLYVDGTTYSVSSSLVDSEISKFATWLASQGDGPYQFYINDTEYNVGGDGYADTVERIEDLLRDIAHSGGPAVLGQMILGIAQLGLEA